MKVQNAIRQPARLSEDQDNVLTSDNARLTDPALCVALANGTLSDPFAVLGPHLTSHGTVIRAYIPGALSVTAIDREKGELLAHLLAEPTTGLFSALVATPVPYRLRIEWPEATQETEDPYSFGLLLGDLDLHLFAQGAHWQLAHRLGAAVVEIDGVPGVRFAAWAPNAIRVSVVGDFNTWDGRRHMMRRRNEAGVWELFIPRLTAGTIYKYEIVAADGAVLPLKADPLARQTEAPPATASIVIDPAPFVWSDADWMANRGARQRSDAPISIYEVHAASWLRPDNDPAGCLDWAGLAERLIPYVARMGFTHVELLPIMEFPFGGSWGYQPLSQFAPTARFGRPQEFAAFVDACHDQGIGVILDWVPAHFPTDAHGLARFDGTALYEHADPREGFHQDWNTLIYNLGRTEVQGFMIASALYWLEQYHVDGLRVDAVASMLYRDYSRAPGQWRPNIHGGRENLESIAFLQRLNNVIAETCPGTITIAEESTAWPGVSALVTQGGLGFNYKWNMGWMHDTLLYLEKDPLFRRWHHGNLTFGLVYAFSERFILPLSHDEVVHGKGSLYQRAPGDAWQKLANLRSYFCFMWSHPGKKLLFMGNEIAQPSEWNHDGEIDWQRLDDPGHAGLQRLVADLNQLYRAEPALHAGDADPAGFAWIIGDAAQDSMFAYLRLAGGSAAFLIVLNMMPVPRDAYRIGVPCAGRWDERLNSDAEIYGGSNVGNAGGVQTQDIPAHDYAQSVLLRVPPLAALFLQWQSP